MAEMLVQVAASSLSKMYGRRVAFAPVVDDRVTASSLIVVMPGRTTATAASPTDPVITVAYETPADERTAEALANFLRTLRSGWKYSVRTERKSAGHRAGQTRIRQRSHGRSRTGPRARAGFVDVASLRATDRVAADQEREDRSRGRDALDAEPVRHCVGVAFSGA